MGMPPWPLAVLPPWGTLGVKPLLPLPPPPTAPRARVLPGTCRRPRALFGWSLSRVDLSEPTSVGRSLAPAEARVPGCSCGLM